MITRKEDKETPNSNIIWRSISRGRLLIFKSYGGRRRTCTICSRIHKERNGKKDKLALSHHHAVHVINVISCPNPSHHMPHNYCGLCNHLFKMNHKMELERTHMEYEDSRKSKIHEGSQIVIRRVKNHPLVIYTPSLYEQRTFILSSSCKILERHISSFEEKGVDLTLHYWI